MAWERAGGRLPRRPLLVKISLVGPQRLTEALKQIDSYEENAAELTRLTSEQARDRRRSDRARRRRISSPLL